MKRTDLAYDALKGCRVSGLYHGVAFTGIVYDRRWHTIDNNKVLVFIKLDSPLTVHNHTRNGICLEYSSKDWLSDNTYIDYIDESTYPNKSKETK